MKNKILTFLGFSVFCVAIYLVYFYKKYDYSKERMKDYICLMKEANDNTRLSLDRVKNNTLVKKTEGNKKEKDRFNKNSMVSIALEINQETDKFLTLNSQIISLEILKKYFEKPNVKKMLTGIKDMEEEFFSEILSREYPKNNLLEKKLWSEFAKKAIYYFEIKCFGHANNGDYCMIYYKDPYERLRVYDFYKIF